MAAHPTPTPYSTSGYAKPVSEPICSNTTNVGESPSDVISKKPRGQEPPHSSQPLEMPGSKPYLR